MFSGLPTTPNSNNAQQGQMIQLCPISTYSVTQRNLEKNPQINLSPSNAVQFNQQQQQIMLPSPMILTQTQTDYQIIPQINLSPPHAVQFNQQHQAKSRLTKEKNYFQLLFTSLIILFHIKNYIIFVVKQENFHN